MTLAADAAASTSPIGQRVADQITGGSSTGWRPYPPLGDQLPHRFLAGGGVLEHAQVPVIDADEAAVAEGERAAEVVLPLGGGRAAPPPFGGGPAPLPRRLHLGLQRPGLARPAVVEAPAGRRPAIEGGPEGQMLLPRRVGAALVRED